ncbi:hypothetical protein CRP01_10770 [Flavilitoribacter nigricans DSM 23189 = NBRC 102662]|uniref:Uncharacterized protein n=1 Tax=Flavilitoribacter nigricans (strain ATCC 23147 / DSM 23189 / NBRC 102662 / NCIMB 1420 / SS-2) TaxID=1122177 RepID=A0A2D0NEG6_FLAN2|nr:hypothetical protein CRP01_10770 [Flavilitoribacter nigricans DSM 23189 = NBRC 102662]
MEPHFVISSFRSAATKLENDFVSTQIWSFGQQKRLLDSLKELISHNMNHPGFYKRRCMTSARSNIRRI